MINGWGISCEIAIRWMPLDLTDDESTLVQVMAWCCQATSHYLSQCWLRSMSPYGVTRPQWVKRTPTWYTHSICFPGMAKNVSSSSKISATIMPSVSWPSTRTHTARLTMTSKVRRPLHWLDWLHPWESQANDYVTRQSSSKGQERWVYISRRSEPITDDGRITR